MLPSTADVIVIGGGVIGLSIGLHLAERGAGQVLVLERGTCGSGATLKATGGFRCQFASSLHIQLSLLSLPFWRSTATRFTQPIRFTQRGYLLLVTTAAQLAQSERNVTLQQSLGVPARLVTPAEAARLAPGINLDQVVAGTYCPWDASLEIAPLVAALIAACRQHDVTIVEETSVTGITLASGRVQGLVTTAGAVSGPVVVNAAGSAAAEIGAHVGVELAVRGERRQAAMTVPASGLDPDAPMTIDQGTSCYARPTLDGGAIIGGADRPEFASEPGEHVDEVGLARLRELVGRRFPALAGIALRHAWAGRRPMTPDDHPLLGPTAIAGFLCACGLGAHGVMHAPAVGTLIAETVIDGAPTSLDIAALSPDRFRQGRPLSRTPLF